MGEMDRSTPRLLREQAMTQVTLDADTLSKLHYLQQPLELHDEHGFLLGYFQPAESARPKSPFSDEEIRERQKQRTGRPLADILRDLEQRS
jgi:hypothetical protein